MRNPYLNRSMIRSLDEFYGRRREVRRILSRIGASTPQSVSVVGERRMGKSSLLWHLAQPEVYGSFLDDADHYLFVSFDFQGQQHLDQSRCCQLLAQQIADNSAGRIERADGDDGLQNLLRVASAARAADLRIVCLFDEFETVTRNQEIGPEFYGTLRSLANTHDVAFVTASRRPLQSLCGSREISESPFFNIFSEIRIGPMSDDEVHELVTVPSAQAGAPLDPYVSSIRDLGGRLPFFLQIAASAAVEHLDGTVLDEAGLRAGFMEEATPHLHYLWENFDEQEQAALMAAANDENPVGDAVELLETHGYIVRDSNDRRRPFCAALPAFLHSMTPSSPVTTSDETAIEPSETTHRRTSRRLFLGVAAGLVALAAAWQWGVFRTPVKLEVAALSPARIEALGLSVEIQCLPLEDTTPVVYTIGPNGLGKRVDGVIADGDRLRLTLGAQQSVRAYVFSISAEGQVKRLPDATARPVTVEPGRIAQLPSGDEWFEIQAGAQFIVVLSEERESGLEDLQLRYQQANAEQRLALGQSLAAELRSRGAVSIAVTGL